MKPWLWILLVAVLLVVAYAVGRAAAPSTSRTVYERVEVEVERLVTVGVTSEAKADQRERIVVVTVTEKPDGTKIEETRLEQRDRHEEARTEVQVVEREVERLVTVEKERLVEKAPPRFHVGFLAGLDAAQGLGGDLAPDVGVEANVRVLGPVSVGAFAFTSGFVGASVGVSF